MASDEPQAFLQHDIRMNKFASEHDRLEQTSQKTSKYHANSILQKKRHRYLKCKDQGRNTHLGQRNRTQCCKPCICCLTLPLKCHKVLLQLKLLRPMRYHHSSFPERFAVRPHHDRSVCVPYVLNVHRVLCQADIVQVVDHSELLRRQSKYRKRRAFLRRLFASELFLFRQCCRR